MFCLTHALRKADAVIVVINMSDVARAAKFDLTKMGLGGAAARTLLTTQPSLKDNTAVKQISLEPFRGIHRGNQEVARNT